MNWSTFKNDKKRVESNKSCNVNTTNTQIVNVYLKRIFVVFFPAKQLINVEEFVSWKIKIKFVPKGLFHIKKELFT